MLYSQTVIWIYSAEMKDTETILGITVQLQIWFKYLMLKKETNLEGENIGRYGGVSQERHPKFMIPGRLMPLISLCAKCFFFLVVIYFHF